MRKIFLYLFVFIATTTLIVSCDLVPTIKSYDETLLYGKWESGTLFYKYLSDGSGATWDTADDVTEAEAQVFTWTLIESELTQNHVLEIGGTVPKIYTVSELTDSTLVYNDDFGKKFSFKKIAE